MPITPLKRAIGWIWKQGIISTFLSGLFAVLPVVLTVMIVTWVARYLYDSFGEESAFGMFLYRIGFQLGTTEAFASIAGGVIVLTSVWLVGLVVKSSARYRVDRAIKGVFERIPIINSVYNTSTQLVAMIRKDSDRDLQAMSPVFCAFDQEFGGGALGLLTSSDVYRVGDRDYHCVFLPSAPFCFSGRVVFVPVDWCKPVDMTAEQVMRIYLSLGVLAHQVMPSGGPADQPQEK